MVLRPSALLRASIVAMNRSWKPGAGTGKFFNARRAKNRSQPLAAVAALAPARWHRSWASRHREAIAGPVEPVPADDARLARAASLQRRARGGDFATAGCRRARPRHRRHARRCGLDRARTRSRAGTLRVAW